MVFSKRSHEGYLMVDHRASPGIPAEQAIKLGYRPQDVAEGKLLESVTYGCPHCGVCYVKNPWRTRPREHCFKCNSDICDPCHAQMQHPDYVHKTFQQLADELNNAAALSSDHARAIALAEELRRRAQIPTTLLIP